MSEKVTAACPACGEKHGIEVWNRINVGENPELKAKVKDGSLFVWECPHCGKANLVQGQTLYHDPNERLMIWLMPDGILPEAQEKALRLADRESKHLDTGLDDCVIEMCKYITKMEMMEKGGSKDLLDTPFKFYHVDGPDNDIEFSYPKDGQMHGLRIGFNVYEDCAGIIRRNPSVKPSPGFSRIDPAWVARFFR